MMTRNNLFTLEQQAEDMKTIKCYLALNPKHTVSYLFGPYLRHELSYDAKKGFCLQAYLNGEALFDDPQKPTQPRSLPISIGRGIGEQRGKINVGCLR